MTVARRHVAGALVAIIAAGCAINPVSGRPEVTLVSEAKERELGEAEAKRVAESMGIFDEPELQAYVRAVGERLARFSPRPDAHYTFDIVDLEEPNAFALPGGPVYVSRGLLALTNSEDELAGVIGHEIGHVAARHAVQRVTAAAPLSVVTGIGALATGIVSPALGGVVGGLGGMAGALVLAPYSREQESEADRVGQDMVAAAGWDPAGLSRLLRTLEREEAAHGGERRATDFFATHPSLPRRVAATEERASGLQRAPGTPIAGGAAYLRKLEGLPIGPRAAAGVFEGATFLHPDLDFHVKFPAEWKTVNDRTAVGAIAPDKGSAVVVEVVGEGTDPEIGVRALEKQTGVTLARVERGSVGGLPTAHATADASSRDGRVALDLTWIAHAGRIFRLTGVTSPGAAERMRATFAAVAASFGPLTGAERSGISELRLHVVAARGGETVEKIVARTESGWSAAMTAVANEVEEADALQAGRPVKVAVRRPYVRKR
jgi:predicted Zn-dependent protease